MDRRGSWQIDVLVGFPAEEKLDKNRCGYQEERHLRHVADTLTQSDSQ